MQLHILQTDDYYDVGTVDIWPVTSGPHSAHCVITFRRGMELEPDISRFRVKFVAFLTHENFGERLQQLDHGPSYKVRTTDYIVMYRVSWNKTDNFYCSQLHKCQLLINIYHLRTHQ